MRYKVVKPFQMDYSVKRNRKDRSDRLIVEEGQILKVIDGVDLLFKIEGTKTGLRLSPWTINECLKEIKE